MSTQKRVRFDFAARFLRMAAARRQPFTARDTRKYETFRVRVFEKNDIQWRR
ncbi:hypothetical protein [Cupriavidus basilensis]|uniref:hypothetical protein n=1 Tax=Cupriavidus basilensis TaxID=68895 RepID=UPI0020A633CA|nr:hypothetical protein [Cupriavidus basilensis]MCP3019130.1 hypothetical protein [Cupriavidus basilensis]